MLPIALLSKKNLTSRLALRQNQRCCVLFRPFRRSPLPAPPQRRRLMAGEPGSLVLFSFLLFPGSLMKAILVPKPGGPEALVWGEAPDPVPGLGEGVVRVRATAVNRSEQIGRAS